MRIGLFTDTYFPSTNGITYVVDILRKNMAELGHDVWVFAPEPRARHWFRRREHNVIRFPALEGLLFDEQQTSMFSPPRQLKGIAELNLDAIIIFTPGQIGLLGIRSAMENDTKLIQQYSTDLVAYATKYPTVVPFSIVALLYMQSNLKLPARRLLKLPKDMRVDRHSKLTRVENYYRHMLNILHDQCDLLIAVSEKSAKQLYSYHGRTPIEVIPTGVDSLPINKKAVMSDRKKWHIKDGGVAFLYVGRLGPEKNIELLIESFAKLAKTNTTATLVLTGDSSYGEELKRYVRGLGVDSRVIFTGRVPRDKLGNIYAAADVFCFPSLTDTQGLVINEAAHVGLPIVWCDPLLNDVAVDGVNGVLCKPNIRSFSGSMQMFASDARMRKSYGAASKKLAAKSTEKKQTKKLIQAIKSL